MTGTWRCFLYPAQSRKLFRNSKTGTFLHTLSFHSKKPTREYLTSAFGLLKDPIQIKFILMVPRNLQ
jgi:hypothetical protein